MKITRGQASLIADLQARLVDKLNIKVGYAHPSITILPDDVDFIICETEEADDEEIQLIHRDDLIVEWVDESTMRILADEEPKHDSIVVEFLGRIDEWLTEGVLWFDPSITKEVDGVQVSVTKKCGISEADAIYDTNLLSPNSGSLYRYGQISFAAKLDRRFRALKKVIDEEWPQDKANFASKMRAIHHKSARLPIEEIVQQKRVVESAPSLKNFAKDVVKYLIKQFRKKAFRTDI
tara:strand:- start:111958 stop:112665 length:708 start_codon:yes stop_codon:yes gene_type:complete